MKLTKECKVSGKPHPKGMEWKFNLTIDYEGQSLAEVYDSAYNHDRVRTQNTILRPLTAKELDAIQETGEYTIKASIIGKGAKGGNVLARAEIEFSAMSPEQQAEYIAKLQAKMKKDEPEETPEAEE